MRVVLIARRKSSIVFDWLKVSFAVFKQKPSTWMAIFALHTLAMLLAQFVPVLGVFFMLLAQRQSRLYFQRLNVHTAFGRPL